MKRERAPEKEPSKREKLKELARGRALPIPSNEGTIIRSKNW